MMNEHRPIMEKDEAGFNIKQYENEERRVTKKKN